MTTKKLNNLDELAQLMKKGFEAVSKQFKGVATKKDLKGLASKNDIAELAGMIKNGFDDAAATSELQDLETDIGQIQTDVASNSHKLDKIDAKLSDSTKDGIPARVERNRKNIRRVARKVRVNIDEG